MRIRYFPWVMVLSLLLPCLAQAKIPKDKIKIGVLQDLPEPYANQTGNGGIVAAQMAAAKYETEYMRGDAEILPGASGNTPEQDLERVRDWLDTEHVAAIVSSAGNAVDQRIAKMVEQRHATLLIAATTGGLSAKLCSPNVVVWGTGPAARVRSLVHVLMPGDDKSWFVTAEQSPAGAAVEAALHERVTEAGGTIAGTYEHPVGATNLRKAADRIAQVKPQIVALAESDGDLVEALRAQALAGLSHQTTLVAPLAQIKDIDNAGLAVAQGLMVVAPYYWDTNEHTRDFARRWREQMQGQHVTQNAAEIYAATLSFLHAAKAVDDVDSAKVLARLRQAPIKETLFGTVAVRTDGRVVHDVGVYRVKPPSQVQQRWAYYDKLASISGDRVFPPEQCGRARASSR